MRILGWNCRGICNSSTVHTLRALIRGQNPMVVFLCETKANEVCMKKVANLIGFLNFCAIRPRGRAGGICMFWAKELGVELLEFNPNTIAVTIRYCTCSWSIIGFHGPPHKAKRRKAWVNLHGLLESIDGPWMCFGDFNVLIDESKKEGGKRGGSSIPSYLKELLFYLGPVNLGFARNKFTWSNKRWGRNSICERLDRGIPNINWRLSFPKAAVYHLGAINSDHCPILVDTNPDDAPLTRRFRFEVVWTKDPRCFEVINTAWSNEFGGSACFNLFRKQFHTTKAIKKWNRDTFGFC